MPRSKRRASGYRGLEVPAASKSFNGEAGDAKSCGIGRTASAGVSLRLLGAVFPHQSLRSPRALTPTREYRPVLRIDRAGSARGRAGVVARRLCSCLCLVGMLADISWHCGDRTRRGGFFARHDGGVGLARLFTAGGFGLLHVMFGGGLLMFSSFSFPTTPWQYQSPDGFALTLPSTQWEYAPAQGDSRPAFVCRRPHMQAIVQSVSRQQTEADFKQFAAEARDKMEQLTHDRSAARFLEGVNAAGNSYSYCAGVERTADGKTVFVAHSVVWCPSRKMVYPFYLKGSPGCSPTRAKPPRRAPSTQQPRRSACRWNRWDWSCPTPTHNFSRRFATKGTFSSRRWTSMSAVLPDRARLEGLEVDLIFDGQGPSFGDLVQICGYRNPNFPPEGRFDFGQFTSLQFSQADDYFGILTKEHNVAIWLFPLIQGQPVARHVGPFDGLRLSYNVLRNPTRVAPHFLKVVQTLADYLPVRLMYRTREHEHALSELLAILQNDIDAILEYWRENGVEPGSSKALEIDF